MNVIINGVNSDTINGLQILSLPPITKPRMRTSIATIDGRPGDIVTPLGYEAYNKTIKILLHDTYDLPAIMAYFNQSGTIIFSNDPDMVYTFETIEAINYERAVKFKTASVTMHVQPYKTSASEQPSEAESESFMDSEPYLFRESPDATMMIDEIVGGSVVFNQLCNAASVTVANGHKYFMKKGTTYSLGASTGTAITGLTSGSDMLIDLTLMFGSTVADYIYSLDTATAGAGVAFFRSLFPKPYYAYNAGEIVSVNTSAHKMVGFNQWDGTADNINKSLAADGSLQNNGNFCVSDYIRVLPNATYYLKNVAPSANARTMFCYGYDKSPIAVVWLKGTNNVPASGLVTTVGGTHFVRIVRFASTAEYGINLSDPSKNGKYEPYTESVYPLDSSLTLRGITKLDANNNLYYDGDIYEADGTVTRKYGYRAYQSGDATGSTMITDGTHTVYKLTTPTTETADPYTNPQVCYPDGTEEYIDERTIPIPVGHNTRYLVPIEITVTNSGNTDSAPSLTITGSGAIEVTIDGLIAFEINMPSAGQITIDAQAMDAMDSDNNLANRNVSGDYNNLRLSPGSHTIIVNGDASSVSIRNASRWL